ncbi:MAG: hypothetical protein U0610_21640 [bacterium]
MAARLALTQPRCADVSAPRALGERAIDALTRIFPCRSALYSIVIGLVLAAGLPIASNPFVDQALPGLASGLLWGPGSAPALMLWGPLGLGCAGGTILVLGIRVVARALAACAARIRRTSGRTESEAPPSPAAGEPGEALVARIAAASPARRRALALALAAGWIAFSVLAMRRALFTAVAAMALASVWLDVWGSLRARRSIPVLRLGWLGRLWWAPFVLATWYGVFGLVLTALAIQPGPMALAVECALATAFALGVALRRRWGAHGLALAAGAGAIVAAASLRFVPAPVAGVAELPPAASWLAWAAGLVAWVGAAQRDRRVGGGADGKGGGELRALGALAPLTAMLVCAGFQIERGRGVDTAETRKLSDVTAIYDLRFEPETRRLYFSSRGEEATLGWIEVDTRETRVLPAGAFENPQRLAISRAAHALVVSSPRGAIRLDLDDFADLRQLERHSSVDVAVANGRTAILAGEQNRTVRTLDLVSGEQRAFTLPGLYRWPYSLLWSAELDRLFVADWMASPWLSAVRLDGTPIATRWVGFMNAGTCVLPGRNALLVARMFSRRVDELDAQTLERRGSIPVGFGVREIDCDPARGWLVALDHFRGVLSVLDLTSHRTLATTRIASGARAVAYDASTRTVYAGSRSGIFVWPLALD